MALINASFEASNNSLNDVITQTYSISALVAQSESFDDGAVARLSYLKYEDLIYLGDLPRSVIITSCKILVDDSFTAGDTVSVGILDNGDVIDPWDSDIAVVTEGLRNVSLTGGTKQNVDDSLDDTDAYTGAGKWVSTNKIVVEFKGGVAGEALASGRLRILITAVPYYQGHEA